MKEYEGMIKFYTNQESEDDNWNFTKSSPKWAFFDPWDDTILWL